MKNSKFYPGNWPTWLKVLSVPVWIIACLFWLLLACPIILVWWMWNFYKQLFSPLWNVCTWLYRVFFDPSDGLFKTVNHD